MDGGRTHAPKRAGNLHVLMMAFGTMSEEEVERLKKELKEVEDWINSWVPIQLENSREDEE